MRILKKNVHKVWLTTVQFLASHASENKLDLERVKYMEFVIGKINLILFK